MLESELKASFVLKNSNTRVKQQSAGAVATSIINLSLGSTTANLGAAVWARAYVTYSDKDGKVYTEYSDMATGVYNQLSSDAN